MTTHLVLDHAAQTPDGAERLPSFCPRYHHAIELIGRRWTGAILRVLFGGPRRFNELLASIPGLSDRLLAERLRELEAEGVVTRRVLAGPPVRVEYELTEAGRDLEGAVKAIASWAERWIAAEKPAGG
ncbi:MAG: helix-turn-helix transcriptional regulator [Chloroflexi bacterium]|nr:helix-turn-helix transcriptional regulator [Chloroflexota bacterium]